MAAAVLENIDALNGFSLIGTEKPIVGVAQREIQDEDSASPS